MGPPAFDLVEGQRGPQDHAVVLLRPPRRASRVAQADEHRGARPRPRRVSSAKRMAASIRPPSADARGVNEGSSIGSEGLVGSDDLDGTPGPDDPRGAGPARNPAEQVGPEPAQPLVLDLGRLPARPGAAHGQGRRERLAADDELVVVLQAGRARPSDAGTCSRSGRRGPRSPRRPPAWRCRRGAAARSQAHLGIGSGTTSPRRRSRGRPRRGAGGRERLRRGARAPWPGSTPAHRAATGPRWRARPGAVRGARPGRVLEQVTHAAAPPSRSIASSHEDSIVGHCVAQRRPACPAGPGRARTRVPWPSWRQSRKASAAADVPRRLRRAASAGRRQSQRT